MKKLNKILSVGLSLAMCAGMVAPAFAARYNIEYGDVTIDKNGHSGWNDAGVQETHSWEDDNDVTITGKTDKHNVTVEDGATANITLENVNIDTGNTKNAAIDIGKDSSVTIELDGTNEVKSGDGKAGVSVGDGASLTIKDDTADNGSLTAQGGYGSAGIGGNYNTNSGDITINGGTIDATGGIYAAGIGGGSSYHNSTQTEPGANAGNITINGGNVTGISGDQGAGIGGGKEGTVGDITINGGTVKGSYGQNDSIARGGAGIGSGATGKAGTITINNGIVTGEGGMSGAGIGAGHDGTLGSIVINNGTVNAQGGMDGAGIGTGRYDGTGTNRYFDDERDIDSITINGGTVTAVSGEGGGAGIGTGMAASNGPTNKNSYQAVKEININGGNVTATSQGNGAGIGGGFSSFDEKENQTRVGAINIQGGNVAATSGFYAAGIGAGNGGNVGSITITGGKVTAAGGACGAGIGAGYMYDFTPYGGGCTESTFGAINITGGDIVATSGRYASGIGNGMNGKGGAIAIKGVDSLTVLGDFYYAIDTRVNSWDIQQSILNGKFKEELGKADSNGLTQALDTEFVVVDAEGNEIKRFTLTADDDFYNSYGYGDFLHESFATLLPEGTYYVFEDSNKYDGSVAGYKEAPGKQIAYVIEESKMLTAPLMQFPSYNVSYKFESGTEGRTLPDEIANMQLEGSTGNKLNYANFLEMVKRGDSFANVPGEGGTWSFNAWTEMRPVTVDGQEITDVELVGTWTFTEAQDNPPEPTDPTDPDPGIDIEDPDVPLGEEPEVEIEDPRVPLAGLFTRADAIGYLWEQTGSPDAELSDFPDVPEDHYWAVAIGWAQDMGIALPDEEGNFRPDDLVLRSSNEPEGELQEFLDRYAVFAGVELAAGKHFYVVAGVSDDIVMGEDAQVIFDEFFAKLEAALAKQAA